jgi:hypothetical protein
LPHPRDRAGPWMGPDGQGVARPGCGLQAGERWLPGRSGPEAYDRRGSRGARLGGSTAACGSRPRRRRTAVLSAARRSCGAVPPWIAVIERACPRTQGMPAWAPRSVRQAPGNRHATATTRSSRSGAIAVRHVSGRAFMSRCPSSSPAGFRRRTSLVRACHARPPENCCGRVYNRRRSPPLLRDRVLP